MKTPLLVFIFSLLMLMPKSNYAQVVGFTKISDTSQFQFAFSAAMKNLNTIKSEFVQVKSFSMLSEKISSKGRFWFKKKDKVRMEYDHPFQYLLIINQENLYMKDGNKSNKMNTKSNKLFQQISRVIVDCVQGTILLNKDFITTAYENKHKYLIVITPRGKELKEFFSSINVFATKNNFMVEKIEMNESSGDFTTIDFNKREQNEILSDSLFIVK